MLPPWVSKSVALAAHPLQNRLIGYHRYHCLWAVTWYQRTRFYRDTCIDSNPQSRENTRILCWDCVVEHLSVASGTSPRFNY